MLHEELKKYKVILASQSPRRKFLLEGLDIHFISHVKDNIEENVPEDLGKIDIPLFLAEYKSGQYNDLAQKPNHIVITADTIVWYNNQQLGKPEDKAQAREMLSKLSGNMHEVITGVCIAAKGQKKSFYSLSKVWFRKLSEEEIDFYLEKYQPYDKAGSYGIQEWLGYAAIEKIEGSFYNVMGLPTQQLYTMLLELITNEKN